MLSKLNDNTLNSVFSSPTGTRIAVAAAAISLIKDPNPKKKDNNSVIDGVSDNDIFRNTILRLGVKTTFLNSLERVTMDKSIFSQLLLNGKVNKEAKEAIAERAERLVYGGDKNALEVTDLASPYLDSKKADLLFQDCIKGYKTFGKRDFIKGGKSSSKNLPSTPSGGEWEMLCALTSRQDIRETYPLVGTELANTWGYLTALARWCDFNNDEMGKNLFFDGLTTTPNIETCATLLGRQEIPEDVWNVAYTFCMEGDATCLAEKFLNHPSGKFYCEGDGKGFALNPMGDIPFAISNFKSGATLESLYDNLMSVLKNDSPIKKDVSFKMALHPNATRGLIDKVMDNFNKNPQMVTPTDWVVVQNAIFEKNSDTSKYFIRRAIDAGLGDATPATWSYLKSATPDLLSEAINTPPNHPNACILIKSHKNYHFTKSLEMEVLGANPNILKDKAGLDDVAVNYFINARRITERDYEFALKNSPLSILMSSSTPPEALLKLSLSGIEQQALAACHPNGDKIITDGLPSEYKEIVTQVRSSTTKIAPGSSAHQELLIPVSTIEI
jgi:hypothetical protein